MKYPTSCENQVTERVIDMWDKIHEVLDDEGITLHKISEQDGEYYNEIEFASPEGEDVVETVWHNNTPEGFVKGFRKCADDFDVDEHVEMWVDSRGKNGVPSTVRKLLDDAESIKNTLVSVVEQLEKVV